MAVKVNLTFARDEYCEHLAARGLRPHTIRTRRSAIDGLISVVGDIQVQRISAEHMDRLFGASNWAANTRNVKRSMYSTFFSWCRNRRYMKPDQDPLFGWRTLKVPQKQRLRVPVSEWGRLFDAVEYPVEEAVLGLGLYLFLRSSEIRSLQLKHVHLDSSEIEVHRVKTGQWDTMPISTELEDVLRRYLRWYTTTLAEQGISVDPDFYLIPPRKKGTMLRHPESAKFIANTGDLIPSKPHGHPHRIVQTLLRRCNYDTDGNREGNHTLRRSGARAYFDELLGSGYDGALRRVQSMLGHSQAQMTEIYLGLDLDLKARNEDLKGLPMFKSLVAENVVKMGAAQ